MIVDIWRVPPDGETRTGTMPSAVLELEGDAVANEVQPISYDVRIDVCDNELIVTGRVSTLVRFVCTRCAELFDQSVADAEFKAFHSFENKFTSVDLTPDIREAILLAFPMHPVCTPECCGLCAWCGTNLNKGSCACASVVHDDNWRALDGVQLKTGGSHGGSEKEKVKK